MARCRAITPQRPHHKGDRAGPASPVPGPIPRHVQLARGDHGRPVPGARHDERRLPVDDLAPVHSLHQLLEQGHAGGGAPEPDHQPEHVQQKQVRLRPERHLQGRLEGHLLLVHDERRRARHPGAPRRVHGERPHRRDAVPAPERRAVQRPVHGVLAGRRGHGGEHLARQLLRLHGAVREQEPEAGVRELPGPGHRPERGGGRRHNVRRRQGLGRAVLREQLPEARVGEGGRGSYGLLQKRAEHPAIGPRT
ncbi:hypothetical protein VPH35_138511 [Triticum aestivum]